MKKLFFLLLFPFMALAQTNTLSNADKVYGLSKFWQEVNYNFVYLNKVDRTKWDNAYKDLITKVQETKSDYEYYRELQKFCALLKDGHTNIWLPEKYSFDRTMFGDYRLFIQNIDGKAIITKVNQSKKDEIPLGSEIVEVNGSPTTVYTETYVTPYLSSSTEYVLKDWGMSRLLEGLEGDTYHIKIRKPDGKIEALTLTHKKTKEEDTFPSSATEKLLDFKWYPNNVAYISLNSFENPKIDSLFIEKLPELYKAKALIVDLRKNGGGYGDVGFKILQYLTNDTVFYGAKMSTRLHTASFKAWGKYRKPSDTINNDWAKKSLLTYQDNYFYDFDNKPINLKLNAKKIVVPTTILLGHSTASAAEDFLILADKQKHMTKIGQNSFGSTGQPYMFDLPGGASARVCTKKDTYPDGREFVGYGIKPDIEVIPTLNDYLQQKDPTLTTALNHLNKKLK